MSKKLQRAYDQIRQAALAYPETYEESPWGHVVCKVRNKMFVIYGLGDDKKLGVTVKLPHSSSAALELPFTTPTGYGLGKSGWVSASFEGNDGVPMAILMAWLDESYRAIAPKKLSKLLDGGASEPAAKKPAAKEPAAKTRKAPTRVVVASGDALRLERAKEALRAGGVRYVTTCDLEGAIKALAKKRPNALIIDLGRTAPRAIEIAGDIVQSEFSDVPMAVAGIRDARMERRAKSALPDASVLSRQAPGDPAVVDRVLQLLD